MPPARLRSVVRSLLPVLAATWMVWLASCASSPAARVPRAVRGVLDARDFRFAEQGALELDGEWEFYWHEDLTPEDFARASALRPGYERLEPWTNYVRDGEPLPRDGYATYHLRVLLPPSEQVLAFEHGLTMTASAFYLDGKPVLSHGTLATTAAGIVPRIRHAIVEFAPQHGAVDIVVRVANFSFLSGGLSEARIGRPRELYAARDRRQSQTLFLIGAIAIMGLYHAGLFSLRRKERAPLYFAGLCLSAGLFALCSGDMFVLTLMPGLGGEAWWKLYMLGWYAGILFLHPLLAAIFPSEYPMRWLRVHYPFVGLMMATVLLFSMRVHLWLSLLFHVYSSLTGILAIVITSLAVRHRRSGAAVLLVGFVVLYAALVSDTLVALRIVPGNRYVTPSALFFFILCQSVLLAIRFSRAFDLVEASERARTRFFHNTSHELRTPLHGILGFVDLLRRGRYGALEPAARQALERVVRLAEGLRGQVNTILDLARDKQGKASLACSRVDLNEVVEELRALAEGLCLTAGSEQVRFSCELSWQPEHESPSFVTDRDKLLTVVRNLLGNAFKFRKRGSQHLVSLRLSHESGRLVVEVRDTGIGIPEHERERIFEEFVQLESPDARTYEGTGLGLAMVRSCVALLSGKLRLDSSEGEGTRFVLELPELPLDAVHLGPATQHAQAPVRVSALEQLEPGALPEPLADVQGRHEVLVVDDNPVNLEVMAELLKSAGYAVLTCVSGREALERIAVQRPDLMLLDMMMPELSGEEVLTMVRADAALRDLPVILLTARASREDRLLGLRLGADDYLAKPVDSGELLLRVRNTLERAQLAHEKAERDQHVAAARAVQEALLPLERSFPGVTVEDHYHAAEQVGGDWFGYGLDAERRRLYVALGDATGHGFSAALVSGAAAGAFRAALTVLCRQELACADALLLLTRALHETVRQTGARAQRMMTMGLLCLDLETGQGCFVNAGHGPILRFGPSGRELLQARGPLLGSDGDAPYVPVAFELTPGDALFVYSDGLIENSGPDGRVLSPRKLHKLLEHDVADLAMLKRLVLREGEAIWREHAPEDDTCFILLRWRGLAH